MLSLMTLHEIRLKGWKELLSDISSLQDYMFVEGHFAQHKQSSIFFTYRYLNQSYGSLQRSGFVESH